MAAAAAAAAAAGLEVEVAAAAAASVWMPAALISLEASSSMLRSMAAGARGQGDRRRGSRRLPCRFARRPYQV